MFAALGRLASRRPWFIIAGWVVFAAVVIAFAPKFEATTDQAEFLPAKYESIKAFNLQEKAFPSQTSPAAIIVFDHADGSKITEADSADIKKITDELQPGLKKRTFSGIQVQPVSENGLIQLAVVGLADDATGFDTSAYDDYKDMRKDLEKITGDTGLRYGITGSVPQGSDSQDASGNALLIVSLATILLIVVLLAVIFRSVIISLLPIFVVFLLSTISTGLIATANKLFDLKASSDVEVILVVVLFGIGTDYILFFLFRYRERLREGEDTRPAVSHALERAGEAIASAGGAVIVSFMALILSSLGIFRSLGPALAIAVAVTLLASLTLVPAVAAVLGKALFWPSKSWRDEPKRAKFSAVGQALGRRPAVFAVASGGVLALLAIAALSFNPSFDFTGSSVPEDADSTIALKRLEKGFPAGATDPTLVLLSSQDGSKLAEADLTTYADALGSAKGVGAVQPAVVSQDGATASYNVVLADDPGSDAAIANIKGPIRDAAHDAAPEGTEALVGGTTSIFVDFQTAMNRDYKVVFPVAALIIMLILALLLRSLVAPVYLMISVGLGFGATLGAAVILFQGLLGDSGLIFLLPIYIYLFVVALGTDYNILMIARLREEAKSGKSSRDAAAAAITHAGPTIAAAGVILAGTFAALMLGGNSLLVSMGFSISFGIFVAAFVMSMFFTPALTALIGHAAWWPGHGDETEEEHDARVGPRS